MHTGFRMAPLWGVDNLHFGSLCFGFSLKSLSFHIAHLVSGVGSGLGPPPPLFYSSPHPTPIQRQKTRNRRGLKHFTVGGKRTLNYSLK